MLMSVLWQTKNICKKMSIAEYVKNRLPLWPNWVNFFLLKINVLGGFAYSGAYVRYKKHLDDIEPEKRLLDMVNFAIRHVPYYRERYGGLEIRSLSDFESKIGYIDKDEVMSHWSQFVADGADLSKCITGTTGGTSGKAMKLLTPRNRYVVDRAFTHRQLGRFAWHYDTFAVIRNHKIPKGRDYLINPVMKLVTFDAFRLDASYVRKVHALMKKMRIRCIHAYPSVLFRFCKLCQEQDLDLSFIRLCRLTSEQITEEQMVCFKQIGFKLSYSYAQSERLVLAGNRPDSDAYFVESAYGYCELIGEDRSLIKESGKMGEIVGTCFNNYYFPLIRYRTGDYSSYEKDVAETPYEKILSTVYGRWQSTLIYCGDGRQVPTSSLNLHDSLYEKIDGLQYIQTEKGKLDILVIKGVGFDEHVESALYAHFIRCLGAQTVIKIRYVDSLIHQPNGKFLLLISKI